MTVQFEGNPHYREYVRLLKQLHDLIAADKTDSDEANAVREELDKHVGHLNQLEYRRAEGLCEDLYTLVEDHPPLVTALHAPPRPREDVERDLTAAWGSDWDRVLELLREGASFIPLDAASYARGRCWQEFGDPGIALLFFARASTLNPLNASYAVLVMNILMQLERYEEAVAIAEECIRLTNNPRLHIKAADVLFNLTGSMDAAETERVFRRIISVTQGALAQEASLPADQQMPSLAVAGYVLQAMAHEAIGQRAEARTALDLAIALDPSNDAARTARGLLNYVTNPASAIADFQVAVASQTPLVWPYFFLAHHFLEAGKFRNCLSMCQAALERTDRANLRADLFQCSAIARYELGAPPLEVEQLFSSAQSLAPFDSRIAGNFERFKAVAARHGTVAWQVSLDVTPEAAVKAMRSGLVDMRLDAQITAPGALLVAIGS